MPWDKEKLERVQAIASIASSIAIPLVLAIAGYIVQRQFTADGLKKDYVQIAANILKENAATQEPDLRKWAVQTLDENSPISFSTKAKEGLQTGAPVVTAGPPLYLPPAQCMSPPVQGKVLKAYMRFSRDAQKMTDQQVIQALEVWSRSAALELNDRELDAYKLKCVQDWMIFLRKSDDSYRAAIGAPSSASAIEAYAREAAASAANAASATNQAASALARSSQ